MNDDKLLNLAGAKTLYNDLRDRIEQNKPVDSGSVKYNTEQTLTDEQKDTARSNIDAISYSDVEDCALLYNAEQELSEQYKERARSNIDALSFNEFDEFANYAADTLGSLNSSQCGYNEPADKTISGVNFVWSSQKGLTCVVSGSPTSEVQSEPFVYSDNLPHNGYFPGATYYLRFASTGNKVKVRIVFGKDSDGNIETRTQDMSCNGLFTIPDDFNRISIFLYIPSDAGTINETITVNVLTAPSNMELWDAVDGKVTDVQVNGTSVVTDGVANVPMANAARYGAVRVGGNYGLKLWSANDSLIVLAAAISSQIKAGDWAYQPIVTSRQHESVYYGLAKAAGADMNNITGETVGVYPEAQKSAISDMLSSPVSVTGTTPTITALSGIQYVCGEVATLDITLPASGIVDVVFESGSTPTVLTITPPTGVMEVEWADGFDPDNLSANATYWLKVIDGKLGVATAWGVQSGGGGGEPFRLIETITLAEDTNIITRSQTPSGQPYNYHSMIVMIDAPAASKVMDTKIVFSGTYAAIYNLTLWSNTISTTKRMSFISIENIGTNLFRLFRNSGQQSTYSNATCELATNRYAGQQDDTIKSVTFGANNTVNMVPAGTVISIYAK